MLKEEVLSFNERRFLEMYRRFYGEEYPAGSATENDYVKGQMMVYLLQRLGLYVGDFYFMWSEK